MPLRTDRGRAAVYRRLWGWPLRSYRHLAGAGIGLVGLVVAGSAAATLYAPPPKPVPARTPTLAAPAAPPAPPTVPVTLVPALPPEQAPPAALDTATQFATRWVMHPPGMTPQQYTGQLAPVALPELLITLADVDPARVPHTRVTGPARATQHEPDMVTADVPTDAGPLTLTLVHGPQGWRVHHMEGSP